LKAEADEKARIELAEAERREWLEDTRQGGKMIDYPLPPKAAPILAAGSAALASPENPTPAPNEVDNVLNARGWTDPNKIYLLGSGTASCLRPAAFAAFKGYDSDADSAPATVELVSVGWSDLQKDWYRTLSGGKCQMPILIADGKVYGESCAITKFFYNRAPDPNPQIIEEIDRAAVEEEYFNYLLKYFALCGLSPGASDYSTRPMDEVQDVVKRVTGVLKELDSRIEANDADGTGGTLTPEGFDAGDCVWLPMAASLYYLTAMPIPQWYPNIWKWYAKCANMPCFAPRGDGKDAGVSFFTKVAQQGMTCSTYWSVSRSFGSPQRHLGNELSAWYDRCDPRPEVSANPMPPERLC